MQKTIVLATPHKRYDGLEAALRKTSRLRITRLRAKEDLTTTKLAKLKPDFVFFPHWSWIIPAEIHERFNCVIFHMTDLPFGRGGSPLQNLIVRGIYKTKLSAIKCGAGLDTGPVYLKAPLALTGSAEEIFQRAAKLMEKMVVKIATKNIKPVTQKGEPVVFQRRKPEDGDLSQANTLTSTYDMIRMLDAEGYPPAFLSINGLRLEFSGARKTPNHVAANVRITLEKKGKSL